ncbi:Zinc finger CCCH domain-containing protein 14 [Apostasia shenzhenica]|uniref:Zinc finger CCCH domain-containing protein 14 n=1 Tax=Apostasia shenzhenica TaxID=1088818 RepID=A0A2H9ZVJ1_9ASPA|nr:Zinc finger CCCH domain-containing protein 14 [Apostasia shenzhenica]
MDSLGAAGKRGRTDAGNTNGGVPAAKRSKDMESGQHGIGSKSKPCTKFFSVTGCPFGENCHFLHYVPGGYNAVALMNNAVVPSRKPFLSPSPHFPDSQRSPFIVKTRMCNKFSTSEGCKFGDKCRFAHGERELGKPILSSLEPHMAPPPMPGRFPGLVDPLPPVVGPAATFGASATAKISVGASLASAIIGKGGVNRKQICRLTGAKLMIRDHDTDPNLRNIELEGSFDQIKHATAMVRELIVNISSSASMPLKAAGAPAGGGGGPGSNYKTKLCDNFTKGSCTFGERCHFAHGAGELKKSAV